MKKIFVLTFATAVSALSFQSCTEPDNDATAWMRIDSLANARIVMLRDSLNMVCMNDVMVVAEFRADSMMIAAMKKLGKSYTPPKKTTTTGSTKTSGVDVRPGSQEEGPKTVTDRKGTVDSASGPKKVTDRKGVNNPPPPPKQ